MNPSDKETRAIFLNFKEIRTLERNCQSLDSEKAYYVSLINLDQKIVKVHYKRLKDKVAKIRSHLKSDDLEEIKFLDETGNLPRRPMSSKLDSNLRIEAAQRRLKLQPRAKSAAPRLMSRATCHDDNTCNTPRSTRVVRTQTRPLTSPAGRNTPLQTQISVRSTKSANSRTSRRYSPRPALSVDDNEAGDMTPVPMSLRRERRASIFVDTTNINTNSNQPDSHRATSPRMNNTNTLSIPRTNSVSSRSNLSLDRNIRKSGSTNSLESPSVVDIKIEFADDNQSLDARSRSGTTDTCPDDVFKKDRSVSPSVHNQTDTNTTPRRKSFSRDINGKGKPNGTKHTNHVAVNGNNNTTNSLTVNGDTTAANTLIVVSPDTSNNVQTSSNNNSKNHVDTLTVPNADMLCVPNGDSVSDPVTDSSQKPRPKTSTQRALETRRKSEMNIRRASAMLAEGKTTTPFDCHEVKDDGKKEKPFRSIRDGALASTDIDKDILASNLGDDLHKEIKKGMLLGEVATSLYLEDKIDHFLDRVDGYVKENPNYTFDPEVTKAELMQKAIEAKKNKPKRNRFRRRQLERRLEENDLSEIKKSRWLRHGDEELDITGVNTLVVDQMKMLNRLKISYDSD